MDFAACGDGPRTILKRLMQNSFQGVPSIQQLLVTHAPFEVDMPPQQMFDQSLADLELYFKRMFQCERAGSNASKLGKIPSLRTILLRHYPTLKHELPPHKTSVFAPYTREES